MKGKIKKFKKVPVDVPISELSPLNINCATTKCEEGLHCFRMTPTQIKKQGTAGRCNQCGVDLIDWERINKKNSRDASFIISSLKNELIRHVYWHLPIDKKALDKALRMGEKEIDLHAQKRMTEVIGIAKPFRKGFTPYTGEVVFYAQHATATCCRRCLQYWYNIPEGRPLTKKEIKFSTDLIHLFLKERLPQIYKQ